MATILGEFGKLFHDRPADMKALEDALLILGVREFEFFEIAWREWYGEAPEPERIERALLACLYRQAPPPWVRQLVRRVREEAAAGEFDRRSYGLPAGPVRPHDPVAEGRWYAVILLAALTIFFVIVPYLRDLLGI